MENKAPNGFQLPDTSGITEGISNTFSSASDGISNAATNLKTSINNTVGDFSSGNIVDAGSEFLESNTIVAKFAFIILVLIGFMFLFRIGMIALAFFLQPSESPYLVKGLINGNESISVPQNSFANNSTVLWSANQQTGIEFTYSVWVTFNNSNVDGKFHHIFNKGTYELAKSTGMNVNSNSPGLFVKYDSDGSTSLRVVMDTLDANTPTAGSAHGVTMDISGIPYKKWVNVVIRCQNRILDIYVNGVLTSRKDLVNVPRQNYGDVFVCRDGGFSGQLSDLRYFAKALNVFEINNVVGTGPNLRTSASTTAPSGNSNPYFLSSLWYKSNR
jgi:hypothetical protein